MSYGQGISIDSGQGRLDYCNDNRDDLTYRENALCTMKDLGGYLRKKFTPSEDVRNFIGDIDFGRAADAVNRDICVGGNTSIFDGYSGRKKNDVEFRKPYFSVRDFFSRGASYKEDDSFVELKMPYENVEKPGIFGKLKAWFGQFDFAAAGEGVNEDNLGHRRYRRN